MWVIIKYNKKEINFLKQDFKNKLGDLPLFFQPKIKYQKLINNKIKFLENDILGDYLICYHEKFKNSKILSVLKNLRGLKYFLSDSRNNQIEIINFVNYCKENQGIDGYLKPSFFSFSNKTQGKFLSGPFADMIFKVIENQKDNLKVLVGNVKTTITKNSNYLYCPI